MTLSFRRMESFGSQTPSMPLIRSALDPALDPALYTICTKGQVVENEGFSAFPPYQRQW